MAVFCGFLVLFVSVGRKKVLFWGGEVRRFAVLLCVNRVLVAKFDVIAINLYSGTNAPRKVSLPLFVAFVCICGCL